MSKLLEKQFIFSRLVADLLIFCFQNGYEVTLGEAWRTDEQQAIYLKKGLTKTKNSQHPKRLAIDLNLFRDGVYLTEREDYKLVAEHWESLNENCVAGYSWGWDANHFQLK